MKPVRKSQCSNPASAEKKSSEVAAALQADFAPCWARLLLEIPLLPMDEHLPRAQEICRELCKTGPAKATAMLSFALNYREFLAIHFRLARAVQPTGDTIARLSPLAGAIVTRDELRFGLATSLLEKEERRLRDCEDMDGIRELRELIKLPRETHRNYQIWLAIDEVLKEWAIAHQQSMQSTCNRSLSGEVPFPTTSDVRRWIAAHPADSRFGAIRTLDEKGWNRLRNESGVNVEKQAYNMLAELSGLKLSAAEFDACDELPPTSVLKIGGRGKASH